MIRHASFILLAISAVATAQPAATTPPAPVLSDGDPSSQVPGSVPETPTKVAPIAPPPPPITPATPIEGEFPSSALDGKPNGADALRLQIFLDQSNFGPGVIDSRPGLFTELATQAWNEVHGHPPGDWAAANAAARAAVPNPLAIAIVPDAAKPWVGPLPTQKAAQAKMRRMTYRSYAEFMAERYHTDVAYLTVLNGSSKINKLKLRDTLIVPNVRPFVIEHLTGALYKEDPALSQRHVVVDTKKNQARFYEAAPPALVVEEPGTVTQPVLIKPRRPNRGLIASFPITPGQEKFIHYGKWAVRNTVEFPTWRYDPLLLKTGKRGSDASSLEIPSGPNSPVGVLWCGLTKSGIGMHGTSDPETIGRARSSGCIRLANWDAVRLPTLIRPGTTVEIR